MTKKRKYSRGYHLLIGRSVLQEYRREWLKIRSILDSMLERMVSGSTFGERVQGGERRPPQEVLLDLKDHCREYQIIEQKIQKMESILSSMSEEDMMLIESYHWRGVPWYELARAMGKSQTAFYRHLYGLEERVGKEWEEDPPAPSS